MKVMVYHFDVYDVTTDTMVRPRRKSQAHRINAIGGRQVEGTGEAVDPALLDEHGRYDPAPTSVGTT
jgi:hypothetical protein